MPSARRQRQRAATTAISPGLSSDRVPEGDRFGKERVAFAQRILESARNKTWRNTPSKSCGTCAARNARSRRVNAAPRLEKIGHVQRAPRAIPLQRAYSVITNRAEYGLHSCSPQRFEQRCRRRAVQQLRLRASSRRSSARSSASGASRSASCNVPACSHASRSARRDVERVRPFADSSVVTRSMCARRFGLTFAHGGRDTLGVLVASRAREFGEFAPPETGDARVPGAERPGRPRSSFAHQTERCRGRACAGPNERFAARPSRSSIAWSCVRSSRGVNAVSIAII